MPRVCSSIYDLTITCIIRCQTNLNYQLSIHFQLPNLTFKKSHFSDFSILISFAFQCERTELEPGDEIDNDCDGKIDEEVRDGKDNDGDGEIDEDLELVSWN